MVTLDGTFLCSWGSPGAAPGEFSVPLSVALDVTGQNVYVSDRGNYRVQLFAWPPSDTNDAPAFPTLIVHPNPFESMTTITYGLSAPSAVEVATFDVTGRLIRSLLNEHQSRGTHIVEWNGDGPRGETLPTGLYFVQVKTSAGAVAKKVLIMR
jgi:hypothetical protein